LRIGDWPQRGVTYSPPNRAEGPGETRRCCRTPGTPYATGLWRCNRGEQGTALSEETRDLGTASERRAAVEVEQDESAIIAEADAAMAGQIAVNGAIRSKPDGFQWIYPLA